MSIEKEVYFCPNCPRSFDQRASVLKHLNNPRTNCIRWYTRLRELIISQEPEYAHYKAEFEEALGYYQPHYVKQHPDGHEEMDLDHNAASNCGTNDDANAEEEDVEGVEDFRGASATYGKGQSFREWVDADKFAHERTSNPFYPFASKQEWEMASFMLRSGMSMADIDEFLSLQMVREKLAFSFTSAKELRGRAELLPSGPSWKATTISLDNYPTKTPITLYYRDALECIQALLANPLVAQHIELTPKKLYRNGRRYFSEWISSDGAWAMQAALPDGATLLGVMGTSDKTNISVMNGDRVAHPFLVSLANIKSNFLMKASNHAFMMAALLPVPKFICHADIRGLLEKRILHHSLDIVCANLKVAAFEGCLMSTTHGALIKAYTPLVSYIADTPEAADLACVMGKTSHLTMASHKTFGDSFRHPERTGASIISQIQSVNAKADPWDIFRYQAESKKLRLSGVHLPFWRDWSLSTEPSKFLTPEPLHYWHRQFYDHDFVWSRNIIGDAELDFRLSVIQPRIGCRHFKEGATHLKQVGGREHRELQRSIVGIIADAAPREVVHAIRALIDFRYFGQAFEIDEDVMERMHQQLAEFHQYKEHIIKAGGREQDHFYIPKLEFMHSVVPSIRWAGVPMQYTADVTEKAHSTEIKTPARTETNHKNYDPQIVRHLDRAEKMRTFDYVTKLLTSSTDLDLDGNGADEEQAPIINPDTPSLAGESTRQIRNLFHAAKAHSEKYTYLERRMFTTASTAFCLNRNPNLCVPVAEAARLFHLPDLGPALADYVEKTNGFVRRQSGSSIIGGQRHSRAGCSLPFTHLQIWYAIRVQVMSPHRTGQHALPAQTLQAQPPGDPWMYGRYDTVLLSNALDTPWPGKGFRAGLQGHTIAQIRLIFRPMWARAPYLMYAQRFDISASVGREPSSGMYVLKRATRADHSRLGDVVEIEHIRIPAEVIPRFGSQADRRLTPYNSMEISTQFRLNKYSNKELLWILESVSL
ncbi:hypothetical protein R3P38DRAFT_2512149 [Favolaschia claudopus]|uniref:DUF6830 domain-containing protein n=1 Tax=Favolaschia claudopus TaxID=2862362 RepID=A0AAW0CQ55_9AGAR